MTTTTDKAQHPMVAHALELVEAYGFTPSAACGVDLERGFLWACSLEDSGPGTYGHPRFEVCAGLDLEAGVWKFHGPRPAGNLGAVHASADDLEAYRAACAAVDAINREAMRR